MPLGWSGYIAFPMGDMSGAKALRQKEVYWLAQQLAPRVAGHALQLGVHEDQNAQGICDNDADRDSIRNDCGIGLGKSTEVVEHPRTPAPVKEREVQDLSSESFAFLQHFRVVWVQEQDTLLHSQCEERGKTKYDKISLDLPYNEFS